MNVIDEWSSPIALAAISALFGFVSSLVLAWYKYRHTEASRAQAEEILDRGRFRTSLMDRVDQLEGQVTEGLERERKLLDLCHSLETSQRKGEDK